MRRLILFDIDGTLLSTNGAARRAFARALLEVYDETGPLATHTFDGKTDPQIATELLSLAGLPAAVIDARLERLWQAYLRELARELAAPDHVTTLYPGIISLLDELRRHPDVCLGLLTGNIARGAALKLESAGVQRYFPFGAFGSDSAQRAGLPPIAVARALAHTGRSFAGRDIVIIGDTPNDVTCGQALGVFAVGVATGRHSRQELLDAGAHAAFDDLADTRAVVQRLLD
jgi:phosphoglycolate phosphatase-like HAD superfamily hydrolase